jgi:hypothetical protein
VKPEGQGERLLLAAILRRAAFDIALYRGSTVLHQRKLWEEAHRWMFVSDSDHFTSFTSVCTILNQDPNDIRAKTLQLRRQDVKKFNMVESYGWV